MTTAPAQGLRRGEARALGHSAPPLRARAENRTAFSGPGRGAVSAPGIGGQGAWETVTYFPDGLRDRTAKGPRGFSGPRALGRETPSQPARPGPAGNQSAPPPAQPGGRGARCTCRRARGTGARPARGTLARGPGAPSGPARDPGVLGPTEPGARAGRSRAKGHRTGSQTASQRSGAENARGPPGPRTRRRHRRHSPAGFPLPCSGDTTPRMGPHRPPQPTPRAAAAAAAAGREGRNGGRRRPRHRGPTRLRPPPGPALGPAPEPAPPPLIGSRLARLGAAPPRLPAHSSARGPPRPWDRGPERPDQPPPAPRPPLAALGPRHGCDWTTGIPDPAFSSEFR